MDINLNIVKSNLEEKILHSDEYPFSLSLKCNSFENEKDYVSYIRNCEKLIRGSIEYKHWREYLRDVLGISKCVLTDEIIGETSISIHHHIPDLFILIKSIINKKMDTEEKFTTFEICQEGIELHYMNKIGYTPLIDSLHEKFHNGFLNIPIEYIRGDYNYFIQHYMKYLDEEDINSIMQKMAVKLEDNPNYSWNKDNYPGLAVG